MPRQNAPRPSLSSEAEPSRALVAPGTEHEDSEMALIVPDDVRADLLRAQADAIVTPQPLPRARIMPAGVLMFEFSDAPEDTPREFSGIIIGSHPRHVLWDQPFEQGTPDSEARIPACSSPDGVTGLARDGFEHRSASPNGGPIACASCAYNQWGSVTLLGRNGKGKACTNQRSVYVLIEGRTMPVELVLPPTSLGHYDEYLSGLLNRQTPVQAVITKFSQKRAIRDQLRWGEAQFAVERNLTAQEFNAALARRSQFEAYWNPRFRAIVAAPAPTEPGDAAEDPNW